MNYSNVSCCNKQVQKFNVTVRLKFLAHVSVQRGGPEWASLLYWSFQRLKPGSLPSLTHGFQSLFHRKGDEHVGACIDLNGTCYFHFPFRGKAYCSRGPAVILATEGDLSQVGGPCHGPFLACTALSGSASSVSPRSQLCSSIMLLISSRISLLLIY